MNKKDDTGCCGKDCIGCIKDTSHINDPGIEKEIASDIDIAHLSRVVGIYFLMSMLMFCIFILSFVFIPKSQSINFLIFGSVNLLNLLLGVSIGFGLLFIGIGATYWARNIMEFQEFSQERHPLRSSEEDKKIADDEIHKGIKGLGLNFKQSRFMRLSIMSSFALLPLAVIFVFRDMGTFKSIKRMKHTLWNVKKHRLLINQNTKKPIMYSDVTYGSLIFAEPYGIDNINSSANEIAKSVILLTRIKDIKHNKEIKNSVNNIVAFSKICTHVGCPLGLYEHKTQRLLCPCHQSTFDLANGGKVVFGPAARSLPQLPLSINNEGYLIAASDFSEPVGPSFWERGK